MRMLSEDEKEERRIEHIEIDKEIRKDENLFIVMLFMSTLTLILVLIFQLF